MKLSDADFVFKVTINFKDVTDNPDFKDEFITLREPSAGEFAKFSENGIENLTLLRKIFPDCVVDSSFETDNGKATGKEIITLIEKSSSMMTAILTKWMSACPFQSLTGNGEK